jgi:hypothetical protein
MICGGLASPAWLGWALPPMWPIKSSIIRPVYDLESRSCLPAPRVSRGASSRTRPLGSLCHPASQGDPPTAPNRSKSGRMNAVLPIGYVTPLEAAEMLLPAMYAGVPDLPIVTGLRQQGIDVKDGSAMDRYTLRSLSEDRRHHRVSAGNEASSFPSTRPLRALHRVRLQGRCGLNGGSLTPFRNDLVPIPPQ